MKQPPIAEKIKNSFVPGPCRETYRSSRQLPTSVLPESYQGKRSFSTAILYLLTPESCSTIHKLPGDKIYHFYLGDPVELLLYRLAAGMKQ